ncbi:MAG: NAD-binding protein [Bacilli bacterium]|jgi:trk system potassium uptake protein TrkA
MKSELIIVIGLSRLGSEIATTLSSRGKYVIVIDREAKSFQKLGDSFTGYKIIGDACKLKNLTDANIDKASEIDIVTDDDDTNIFLFHLISKMNDKGRIIIRLTDINKRDLLPENKCLIITPLVNSFNQYLSFIGDKEI